MNFIKIVAVLSLLAFLAGCSSSDIKSSYAPTEEEIKNADYGAEPNNYKATIEAFIRPRLLDPESGKFTNYSIPKKDWLARWEGFANVKHFGWLVCVDVNGKNAYGGYTGSKPYFFILQGEQVLHHQREDTTKSVAYAYNYPIECKY